MRRFSRRQKKRCELHFSHIKKRSCIECRCSCRWHDRLLLDRTCVQNIQRLSHFLFLFLPSFFLSSLPLSLLAKCHSFASHSDSRHSYLSLSRSTPSLVDRRRVTITGRRTPIRYILQLSRRRSLRLRRVPRPGISFPLFINPLPIFPFFSFLSLLPFFLLPISPFSSFSVSSRRIITRKPEFHFTLIERSWAGASADVSVVRRTTSLSWFIESKRILGARG